MTTASGDTHGSATAGVQPADASGGTHSSRRQRLSREHSRRIQILRIVLILTIVCVHIPPAAWDSLQPTYSADWFLFAKVFFNRIFSRSAVPALSAISGFLVFSGILYTPYRRLMLSKCKSLLWPLFLWNSVVLVAFVLLSRHAADTLASAEQLDASGMINALFGVFGPPINFPLAFLRDLFACAALSPILWFVLKRWPYVGLAGLFLIAVADIEIWVVHRQTMLLCFYLGGLIVIKRWNLNSLDQYAVPLAATYMLCALALTWLICRDPSVILAQNAYAPEAGYLGVFAGALKGLGVPAFWAISSLLEKASFSAFLVRSSRFAFLIYCAHMPMMQVLWRIWVKLVGNQAAPTYPIFYFTSVPVTVALIVIGYMMLSAFSPGLLAILEGGRMRRASAMQS